MTISEILKQIPIGEIGIIIRIIREEKERIKMEVLVKEEENNFIWCYRKNCIFYYPAGKDRDGEFGCCKKENVTIDRYGKCKSEKIKDTDGDKKFDMFREQQDYAEEVKLVGGKVE